MASPSPTGINVLVTGANGYIGSSVAHAFQRAGYTVYGLVRQVKTVPSLAASEIIPIVGSADEPSAVLSALSSHGQGQYITFSILVSASESSDYIPHYNATISLFRTLAVASNNAGIRPLVQFTSGCKDYGPTVLASSPDLAPHTELSSLNPQPSLVNRCNCAVKTFENADVFDSVVLRPTHVYGYYSSAYAFFFRFAEEAAKVGQWDVDEDGMTILHACHVDDCADAYVAIAEAGRDVVKGQCYNISAEKFETLHSILTALSKEYGIKDGVKYVQREGPGPRAKLFGYSQWLSSDKLRKDTGWKDKQPLFSKGLKQYRVAYEEAFNSRDERLMAYFQKVTNRQAQATRK